MSLDMTGWDQFEARLKSLGTVEATKAGQSANRAGGAYLVEKARAAAQVGPTAEGAPDKRRRKDGTLRVTPHAKIKNHIRIKKGRATSVNEVVNLIVVDPPQAGWEEFGSIHNAPTHWLEKLIESEAQAALDVMAKALDKGLIRRGV